MKQATEDWRWESGSVDQSQPHIELRYGDAEHTGFDARIRVALIGEPAGHCFPVQWLLDPEATENAEIVAATREELDFYLVEKGEWDPWGYARYHCGTSANMYSSVHWAYYPSGAGGERRSSVVSQLTEEQADTRKRELSHGSDETA